MKKISSDMQGGFGLLFALGLLALLMILATAFAASGIYEQRSASASSSTTNVRFLVNSLFERIPAMMQAYRHGTSGYGKFDADAQAGYLFLTDRLLSSSSSGSQSDDDRYAVRKLHTYTLFGPEGNSVNRIFDGYKKWETQDIKWEYIYSKDKDDNKIIIGRYAYVMVPNMGFVPEGLVQKYVDETLENEVRLGNKPAEMNLNYVLPDPMPSGLRKSRDEIVRRMNYDITPNTDGRLHNSWLNYNLLFQELFGDDNVDDDSNSAGMEVLTRLFVMESAAFGNEYKSHKRFSLKNYKSERATALKMVGLDTDGSTAKDSGAETIPFLSKGDSNFKSETEEISFGFEDEQYRRLQIAANIIDYNDTDIVPTSDINASDWRQQGTSGNAKPPKYTGNERTPYINEVGVKCDFEIRVDTSGAKIELLGVYPFVELINIFSAMETIDKSESNWENYSSNMTAHMGMRLKIGVSIGDSTSLEHKFVDDGENYQANIIFDGTSHKEDLTKTGYTVGSTHTGIKGTYTTGKSTNATLRCYFLPRYVILTDSNGNGWDYVAFKNGRNSDDTMKNLNFDDYSVMAFSDDLFSIPTMENQTRQFSAWLSFEVLDPRQNLNFADWQGNGNTRFIEGFNYSAASGSNRGPSIEYDGGSGNNGTWTGSYNFATRSNLSGGTKKDEESGPMELGNISTAYIRNAPMRSLWEMGFISRGKAFQTINLKRFKDSPKPTPSDNRDSIVIGQYSDGDANILDQVTTLFAERDKDFYFSVNHLDPQSWEPVFANIQLNEGRKIGKFVSRPDFLYNPELKTSNNDYQNTYDDDETHLGNKTVTRLEANKLGEEIRDYIENELKSDSNYRLRYRSHIVNAMESIPGKANNDASQEELIGKMIGITHAGGYQDYYTILLVAQTIQDVGGPNNGAGMSFKVPKPDGTGSLDINGAKLGKMDYVMYNREPVYADRITAEAKVKAVLRRTSGGAYKVVGVEYMTQ